MEKVFPLERVILFFQLEKKCIDVTKRAREHAMLSAENHAVVRCRMIFPEKCHAPDGVGKF